MRKVKKYEKIYRKGMDAYNKNDFDLAYAYFQESFKDEYRKIASLTRLVKIDTKEGNFKAAREKISEYQDLDDINLLYSLGNLEEIENNFNKSKECFNKCLNYPKMQKKALLALAWSYFQLGDYEIAKKMYETLIYDRDFAIQATMNLAALNIYMKDYYEARSLLETIKKSDLNNSLLKVYNALDICIMYYLDELELFLKYKPELAKKYYIRYLTDKSDSLLIEHIARHRGQEQRIGGFFGDLDLERLLEEAREKTERINANHFGTADMYRFSLDREIGYKGDITTKDICVVKMLGANKIITMYPILLSSEFDKESFLNSEELRLKRVRGDIIR